MKSDTTSIGVEKWFCPKVVHINYNSQQKNNGHSEPIVLKKQKRNEYGH